MSKKSERIINAFINCVTEGVFTFSYAVTLIEDQSKYGFLSDEDKENFYIAMSVKE